jgi:hypothetical protein
MEILVWLIYCTPRSTYFLYEEGKIMKRILFFLMVLTFLMAAQANANVVRNAGTPQFIIGVTGYTTYGDDMVGMSVKASFANNTNQTVFWQATGPQAGAALGTDWSLSLSGDSFNSNWTLSNSTGVPMISLLIDPFPGETVFDTLDTFTTPPNTPGSENGAAEFADPLTGTYTNLVGIIGDASSPYGDLYQLLEVTFGPNYLASGDRVTFIADTDSIGIVPIPGSVLLLGSGLLGLVGFRFRRR